MKREGTIGAATFLAIAAAVGFSVQTGPKPAESNRAEQKSTIRRSKPSAAKAVTHEHLPACTGLKEELEDFLEIGDLILPEQCYKRGDAPKILPRPELTRKTSQLKFVIATLPDPVHTHLPALFDQFAVAIQEGAQDEKYDFDGSWLPWDDEESSYALLEDEKASNREKELKEDQPGIILFRKVSECGISANKSASDCKDNGGGTAKEKNEEALTKSYCEGLVVFVVGEEATHGIHREQFRNSMAWIAALQPKTDPKGEQLAILAPTFSGSLPSIAQVLSERKTIQQLDLGQARNGQRLAIYSGSVSSNQAAHVFQDTFDSQVIFHSFVQNDDEILKRFCTFIKHEQPGFDASRVAIISEDETAYGGSGLSEPEKRKQDQDDKTGIGPDDALKLYYPRDISALRGAYQSKSLFDVGAYPQSADTQKRNLPTDLADPAGKVHDSIRSYGGNQTPLSQEAFLMEMVAALRELHARYILLRSSNTLDQLFLTNFLRRSYPDGRIVILGSDLMFIRERGATGLSGTMALSTYPLFPLERDWTEHQSLAASDRVFSTDTSEGTYVAFRLLLNDKSLNNGAPAGDRCHVADANEKTIFLPSIVCTKDPPIPDYSPPFWTLPDQCGEKNEANTGDACPYPGPSTWLSVIGVNRFWPMASLAAKLRLRFRPGVLGLWESPKTSYPDSKRAHDPGGRPEMPLGMRVFLLVLMGFSLFHLCCCWFGSYTAKPAFRAHFASTGDWRHWLLVLAGSTSVAFLAIVAGWGCGVFYEPATGLAYPWLARFCVTFVCMVAWGAILGNAYTAWRLSRDIPNTAKCARTTTTGFIIRSCVTSGLMLFVMQLFYQFVVIPLERPRLIENRVMTYWRAMHLASGVSPIVPILAILIGLYLSFWFTFHGLALFGPDRPCLPPKKRLAFKVGENTRDFLRMFSQEDAAKKIEEAAIPLNWQVVAASAVLFALFLFVPWKITGGVPVRSLGTQTFSIIFLVGLDVCCSLALVEAWRLYGAWEDLRRLLEFLDRLPLRRTLAALHGFSWGSVWKMSGNVLEVRYKVISRQMECMNHTIESLQKFLKDSSNVKDMRVARNCLAALMCMRRAGFRFAAWYSINYTEVRAGDLTSFTNFQNCVASASGTLLTKLLLPTWRKENESLIVALAKDENEEATPKPPAQAKQDYVRNSEEFVCLNYLAFVQNVLGRLRTMVMTIVVLFLAAIVAISTYPFDPRQALSMVLIVLFVITGAVIVKVYAEMHRDATLSHVTNTRPGEFY